MHKIVVDTNVLVSSRLSKTGSPAKVMEMVADEKAKLIYSSQIVDEYRKVLAYDKFKFDIDKQRVTIDDIIEIGELVNPITSTESFDNDESDRVFYDAAKSCGAILVTGNIKHYPDESFYYDPGWFSCI